MADPVTWTAVVMTAATAYSVNESNKARKDAKEAAKEQERQAARQEQELKFHQDQADKQKAAAANASADRQRRNLANVGKRNTILTSPLGLPGEGVTGAPKTLLGQ